MTDQMNTTPTATETTPAVTTAAVTTAAVRPEDLLPVGAESGVINGVEVRKGSVAAFLANAKLLESVLAGSSEEAEVEAEIRVLAPKLRALGMLEVFTIKSPRLAALIDAS